jgi:hypothetical protein
MIKVRLFYWDETSKDYEFASEQELYEFIRSSGDAVIHATILD